MAKLAVERKGPGEAELVGWRSCRRQYRVHFQIAKKNIRPPAEAHRPVVEKLSAKNSIGLRMKPGNKGQ